MRTAFYSSLLVSIFCVSVPTVAHATDYAQPGPLAVTTTDWTSGSDAGKVTVPTGPGPYPILVLGHGFSAKPENQSGWGEHFASYGFIAIAPALTDGGLFSAPEVNDTTADNYGPKIVQRAIAYVTGSTSGLAALADGSKIGLEGHSAGGQVMTLTAKDLHPAALVLFDPVPGTSSGGGFPMGGGGTSAGGMDNEPGQSALTQVCSPTLGIFAELANSCNKNSAWKSFAMTSTGPRAELTVNGTNHCDGENAARQLCGFACGGAGADATRQTHFAHYATAWFLSYLKGDADANAELALTKLQADSTISEPAIADGPTCDGSSGAGGTSGSGGASGSAGNSSVGGASGTAGTAGTTAGRAGDGGASGNAGGGGDAGVGGNAGASGASGASAASAGASGSDSTGGAGAGGSGNAGASISTGGAGGNVSGSSGTSGDEVATSPSSSDGGGCALAPTASNSSRFSAIFALFGIAALVRRRRA